MTLVLLPLRSAQPHSCITSCWLQLQDAPAANASDRCAGGLSTPSVFDVGLSLPKQGPNSLHQVNDIDQVLRGAGAQHGLCTFQQWAREEFTYLVLLNKFLDGCWQLITVREHNI